LAHCFSLAEVKTSCTLIHIDAILRVCVHFVATLADTLVAAFCVSASSVAACVAFNTLIDICESRGKSIVTSRAVYWRLNTTTKKGGRRRY
jgi:hypothetical protein